MPVNERGYEVPTLATDAVLVEDGRVLLIQRGKDPFAGAWALPGGFVEVGETVEDACIRELVEETGIEAETRELIGVYSDPERDPRGHVVSVPFLVDAVDAPGNRPAARGGDDAARAEWFDLEDPPGMAFDHARILGDARAMLEASRSAKGP